MPIFAVYFMMWHIRIILNLNNSCCYFQGCNLSMVKCEVRIKLAIHTYTLTMEEPIIRDKDDRMVKIHRNNIQKDRVQKRQAKVL